MAATFSGRTKKDRAAARAAWNQAIRESRVVNFGDRMRAYNSAAAAQAAVAAAQEDGIAAFIIPAHLAEA
jgi:hypothetical protein